jgi:2-polyprenyl-3-methyl-5-hydroxy-6-metoxy-1,4-benzoquinol methylase
MDGHSATTETGAETMTRVEGPREDRVGKANVRPPLTGLSPHEAVQAFCELFRDELDHRSIYGLDDQELRRYYRSFFLADGSLSPLAAFGYTSRLAPALLAQRQVTNPPRLLDAGCGYGTESLLVALSGADVTGVELVPERVKLARSRLQFYQESASATLPIQFINADVVRYLGKTLPFDIIWIMEAISHIHPLELFLPLASKCLSTGGFLITSDPNALNPIARYRAYRIRGTRYRRLRVKARDPDSGVPVCEAVERIFSVLDYTQRISQAGFSVTEVVMSGFLGSSFVPLPLHRSRLVFTLLVSLQRMLQEAPALRFMGAVYTVVARKTVCGDEVSQQRTGPEV